MINTIVQYLKHIYYTTLYGVQDLKEDRTGTPWTVTEVQDLEEFLAAGLTANEISERLNRSEASIYQKKRRMKLSEKLKQKQ